MFENAKNGVRLTIDNNVSIGAEDVTYSFWHFCKKNRLAIIIIFLLYSAVFVFVFRSIIYSIPSIWRGEATINSDELVPFFDIRSQFLDQILGKFSPLTHQYEFRVRYSLLTTWMRYFRVLPIAIVIVPIVSAFILCLSVSYFLHKITSRFSSSSLLHSSALVAMFIEMILLYTKITHFYTLIIGFTLYAVSFLLLSYGLFINKSGESKRIFFAASILTLFNPAIHYIVLYAITILLFSFGQMLFLLFAAKSERANLEDDSENQLIWKQSFKRIMYMWLISGVALFLPYAIFIQFFVMPGIGEITDKVAVNYYFIRNASVPLLYQLSFDVAAPVDNFIQGKYLPTLPRYSNIFYFFLVILSFVPALFKQFASTKKVKQLLLVLLGVLIVSMWCSLGYSGSNYIPTFHRVIGYVVVYLMNLHSAFAEKIASVITSGIYVLRYPHRFQLLTLVCALIIMPIGTAFIEERFLNYYKTASVRLEKLIITFLFFVPLFSNWDIRYVFTSGDFGTFLAPYPLERLREVRDALHALSPGTVLVIPPSEASKHVVDSKGIAHRFIDKFYIYYLNMPSYYFGLDADIRNKMDFFLFYRALYYGDDWWFNILREKGVKYIIVNKELGTNQSGNVEYLKGLEHTVTGSIGNLSNYIKKIFENDGFLVYENMDFQGNPSKQLYFNVPWDSFLCYQQSELNLTRQYHVFFNPREIGAFSGSLLVAASDREKAYLDLFALMNSNKFTLPENPTIPFSENLVPSSVYSGNIYSMWNLFQATKYNYLKIVIPGIFDTLTGAFVGMPVSGTLQFRVGVSHAGSYQVYLRTISTLNNTTLSSEGGDHSFQIQTGKTSYFRRSELYTKNRQPIGKQYITEQGLTERVMKDIIPVSNEFQYLNYGSITLEAGSHIFTLHKFDNNPLVVEGLLLIPVGNVSEDIIPNIDFIDPQKVTSLRS